MPILRSVPFLLTMSSSLTCATDNMMSPAVWITLVYGIQRQMKDTFCVNRIIYVLELLVTAFCNEVMIHILRSSFMHKEKKTCFLFGKYSHSLALTWVRKESFFLPVLFIFILRVKIVLGVSSPENLYPRRLEESMRQQMGKLRIWLFPHNI